MRRTNGLGSYILICVTAGAVGGALAITSAVVDLTTTFFPTRLRLGRRSSYAILGPWVACDQPDLAIGGRNSYRPSRQRRGVDYAADKKENSDREDNNAGERLFHAYLPLKILEISQANVAL